jgi:hypothetical protein
VTWTLDLMRRLRASLADGTFETLRRTIEAGFAREPAAESGTGV